MKKIKVLVMAVVMTICLNGIVFAADTNTLNVDAVIDSAVNNSSTIKLKDISLQKMQNTYNDYIKNLTESADKLTNNNDSDSRLSLMKAINDRPMELKYSIYQLTNSKEVTKNQLKLAIYQEYNKLVKLKDSFDIEQSKLNNANLTLKSAQLQYNLGVVSKKDLKQKETDYATEQASFNKVQRQFNLEVMAANNLIGAPLDTKYNQFPIDCSTDKIDTKTYEDYLKDALKNRVEILNDTENIKLMKSEYDTVKAFYDSKDDNPNKDAKYNLDSAENQLETDKINISIEINNLYNDLQNKYKSLESVKKSYDEAKKDFNKAQQKYNLGMTSKLQFNSDTVTFKQAESNLKNLQRDIWIAQLKLNYASSLGAGTSSSSSGQGQ